VRVGIGGRVDGSSPPHVFAKGPVEATLILRDSLSLDVGFNDKIIEVDQGDAFPVASCHVAASFHALRTLPIRM
jgi:hypothetical protein